MVKLTLNESSDRIPSKLEIAYAAGFLDADGTIIFTCKPRGDCYITVAITQKDRAQLEWFEDKFGGWVRKERDRYWRWKPTNKEAFLRMVYPYLVQKKERVRLLIEDYYDGTFKTLGKGPRSNPITPEMIEQRKALHKMFREVNYATTGKPSRGGDDNDHLVV